MELIGTLRYFHSAKTLQTKQADLKSRFQQSHGRCKGTQLLLLMVIPYLVKNARCDSLSDALPATSVPAALHHSAFGLRYFNEVLRSCALLHGSAKLFT